MLEFLRHYIESISQFADFRTALDVNALREIPRGDRPAEVSEHLQGIGDAAGGENADANTESDGHHRKYAGVALHLVNPAIGLGSRLLHDHRPVQIIYGTVGAEHSDVGIAVAQIKFPRRGHHLYLRARLNEVAHNLQARHVLPGGVARSSADH